MADTERVAGLPPRPSLDDVAERVGNEAWLAALALLRLSPAVAADAAQWASWDEQSGRYTYDDPDNPEDGDLPADLRSRTFHPHVRMDWDGWVTDVDTAGRGWSGGEHRLFTLAAALVIDGRTVPLRGVLDQLGSWEADALDVLVQWASGGNNREHLGRFCVTPSTELADHAGHSEAGGGGPREPRSPGGPSEIGGPGGVGGDNPEAGRG